MGGRCGQSSSLGKVLELGIRYPAFFAFTFTKHRIVDTCRERSQGIQKSPPWVRRGSRAGELFLKMTGKKLPLRKGRLYLSLVCTDQKFVQMWSEAVATGGKIYFISDAHLGEDSPQAERSKEERLIAFLRHIAEDASFLYIVGDLFDFWFEYKHAVPARHHRVLHQLASMVQRGTRAIYVAGNHDFWLGHFLTREIGMEVSGQPLEVEHQGLKLFVAHGDGMAAKDRGYRLLKRILRHPFNIWLYRQIHPDIGLPLARLFSASSRAYTDQRALELVAEYEKAARQKLSQGFDAVILGHSHYPILRHFGEKIYLNLGDWITHFTYGVLQDQILALKKWNQITESINVSPPTSPS